MKTFIFLFSFFFCTIQIFGQLPEKDKEWQNYYKKGVSSLEIGKCKTADSLFSLALYSHKNIDIYFNKAISKIMMYDTLGFCKNMGVAANKYFDKEANKIFNNICCNKIDTIYYDKKYNKCSKQNYRYYEEIKYSKYDTITLGTIHDIKTEIPEFNIDFGCDYKTKNNTSDIIGIYTIKDSNKIFLKTTKKPTIDNIDRYKKVLNYYQQFFSVKYSDIKKEYKTDKITVYFYIFLSETGEITDIKFAGFFPKVLFDYSEEDINKDLSNFKKRYPRFFPARFFKKKVKFKMIDSFSF